MPQPTIEFGLNTFADAMTDTTGRRLSDAETLRRTVDQAVLAEEVGIDIFSVGEHYRWEMLDSAPPVILAAIAGRTQRIRLGSSVTVLSTQDPVRVFHQFATLDAVSNGRAQLIVGRASSIDSFPLFGYDLADYEQLFEEKLELWVKLLREQPVTWSGTTRPALVEQTLYPRIEPGRLPTWVGVGGSPESVVRAARHGLPLMLAIIGGQPARFAGHVELYFRALQELGQPRLPVAQHSIGLVAETDEEAMEAWWPAWQETMTRMSAERGFRPPTPDNFRAEVAHGALFVGSPETVARKIVRSVRDLRLSRFDLKHDIALLPWEHRERTIELYGREVIPMVRAMLAEEGRASAEPGLAEARA